MAGNPEYQNLDPFAAPDPVTPAASPVAGYSMVTPSGQGTAPYDIQADLGAIQADVTAGWAAAGAVAGAGVVYPQGTRQVATARLLDSAQGFNSGGGTSGYDITPGWAGEPYESWPDNPEPTVLETPDQGQMGTYPASTSTVQDGLQKYGTS
jgi:hypothetical protein